MYSSLILIGLNLVLLATSKTTTSILNCNGGVVLDNKCLCKLGYTGEFCDVILDKENMPSITENEKITKIVKLDEKIKLKRFKRETNDTNEGFASGSGEMMECSPGQARVDEESNCLDVASFYLLVDLNDASFASMVEQNIDEAFQNNNNFVNLVFTPNATEQAMQKENESTLSIIGAINFKSQSNYTSIDVTKLLSTNRAIRSLAYLEFIGVRDLNECTEMENACSGYDNICVNTEGSFTCRCDSGVKDETPPNTRATQSRICQAPSCRNFTCLNFGDCFIDAEKETRCSCINGYGGERCEDWLIWPWYQATIALGVICGFFLLLFVLILVIGIVKRQKKETSKDIPMVTGYKNPSYPEEATAFDGKEETNGSQANNADDSEKGQATTSTFKPNDAGDDKL